MNEMMLNMQKSMKAQIGVMNIEESAEQLIAKLAGKGKKVKIIDEDEDEDDDDDGGDDDINQREGGSKKKKKKRSM